MSEKPIVSFRDELPDSPLDLSTQISRLDQLIRTGHGADAKSELLAILNSKTKIPRENAVEFAKIARRLSQPSLSLQIMRPYIHPRIPIHPEATESERAVYAGALAKMGAASEALMMLEQIDASKYPEVYFHTSTVYFQRWDYAKAIPLLKKYVKHKALSDYEALVGKINLAAAFVLERKDSEAAKLLAELLETTKSQNLLLLYGNALELSAQREIFAENFTQAEKFLQLGRESLGNASNLSEFFIRKWTAILELQRMGSAAGTSKQKAILDLDSIRKEAIQREHWETVRECDFYLSLSRQDQDGFLQVYFGTPFYKYRERMKSQAKFLMNIPSKYIWYFGAAVGANRVMDIYTGQENGVASIPVGSVLLRALGILSQDFYRPVSEGSFFAELFPDEYFNPESSSSRLSQVIHRLRDWMKEKSVPLEIETKNGSYRLVATASYGIQVLQSAKPSELNVIRLEALKLKWPYQSFSSATAAVELKCSSSAAVRLLKWAIENKKIYSSGQGRALRYHFAK
jgi:tetratricopeptide (TPR) repeat protein